jgi:hypothetical protein
MKLSLDALKERAEATASTELLDTISGGTTNSCHPIPPKELPPVAPSFIQPSGLTIKLV